MRLGCKSLLGEFSSRKIQYFTEGLGEVGFIAGMKSPTRFPLDNQIRVAANTITYDYRPPEVHRLIDSESPSFTF
ncbi:hypothetical protein AXK11_04225 [Cephaloticoccus primus]|uniref:Uncharacterized protein n=1 Tax=Cephaloticoccus primus TaxID=1548207 RepID=A0A139SPV2_9BACT|nr:hypothetical protein AXK11_04225 [Cephaloticoccus primus]